MHQCDLCGHPEAESLIRLGTGRAMRSDRVVVAADLDKSRCCCCGLVRSTTLPDDTTLRSYYGDEYTVAASDYVFWTADGPLLRSEIFCSWLSEAMGVFRWEKAKRCLEVGAGAGALMEQFVRRFPHLTVEGVELGPEAKVARERGFTVRQSPVEEEPEGQFDIVYCIAVLEHVRSPSAFLAELRKRLRPGGLLYLSQPTQDVPSYDLFFVDHLYHFGTDHLRAYARKCGFRELGFVVGHRLMPNFSLHLWQAEDLADDFAWHGPPGRTDCAAAAQRISNDLHRLDETLADLQRRGRVVATFGLNEVFGLARAYSNLGTYPLCCGLSDDPAAGPAGLSFPVLRPEACSDHGVEDVLLTVNAIYYPQLIRRLTPLGVAVHPVLT